MNLTYAHINSYLQGTSTKEVSALVENEMENDPSIMELVERKREETTLVESLIPQLEVTQREIDQVNSDLNLIAQEIIQEDKKSVLEKFAKVLDTTIIEF